MHLQPFGRGFCAQVAAGVRGRHCARGGHAQHHHCQAGGVCAGVCVGVGVGGWVGGRVSIVYEARGRGCAFACARVCYACVPSCVRLHACIRSRGKKLCVQLEGLMVDSAAAGPRPCSAPLLPACALLLGYMAALCLHAQAPAPWCAHKRAPLPMPLQSAVCVCRI